ncbi:cytochrome P450 [Amycolatopsis sp. NPDC006125]|uniref:cytochrome P450 n=1 Tax=Amycolatopsis sp. NPDC006125 TaxID=3156730 RepID=UPI0033AEFCB5
MHDCEPVQEPRATPEEPPSGVPLRGKGRSRPVGLAVVGRLANRTKSPHRANGDWRSMMTQQAAFTDFNPMESPHRENPHLFYKWSRTEQPICFSPTLNAYVVTRYDDIKSIVDDPDTYSSSNAIPVLWQNPEPVVEARHGIIPEAATVVNTDEPQHAPLRKVLDHAFSGRRIRQRLPLMRTRSAELVDQFAGAHRADLVSAYADPYVQSIVSDVFGIPAEDNDRVQGWTNDYLTLLNPMVGVEEKVAAARRMHDYERYIDALAEQRRTSPRDDFMTDLVHGTDMVPAVSRDDLHYMFRGLRFAGHDTTRDLMTSTLLLLLDNDRRLWEMVRADRPVLQQVIEETLRRDAPHRGLMRVTTRDVEIGGTPLPAGTSLLLLFGSANRDESRFAAPDEVRLSRANIHEHLAFGSGIHQCPGAQLARTEVRTAIETLLDRLPDLRLAPGYEPSYVASFFFRGLERLEVTW